MRRYGDNKVNLNYIQFDAEHCIANATSQHDLMFAF